MAAGERSLADTDRAWRLWGEKDPYFGVLSHKRFRRDTLDAHRAEFFETGEVYVRERLAALEALGPMARRRALDFGCGVGRITLALAHEFSEVIGIDIAPAMLAEARRNAQSFGLDNATFALSDDTLSNATGLFDLVHTYIVLQHIPVARGMTIVDEMLRKVAPGGVASLHFSTEREPGLAERIYRLRSRSRTALVLSNLVRGRRWDEPMMEMNEYRQADIEALLRQHGFGDAVVSSERHGRYRTVQLAARRT